nr:YwqG family protein [Clostridium sp. JN-1]
MKVGMEYPKASNGEYLRLLAQINFEEVPHLEPFPQKGILQFFILADDVYGLDFKQGSYVRYRIYNNEIIPERFYLAIPKY